MRWHTLLGFLVIALLSSCSSFFEPEFDPEKDCWNSKLLQVQLGNDIYEFPYDVGVSFDYEAKQRLSKQFTIITPTGRRYSIRCQSPDDVPLKVKTIVLGWGGNKIVPDAPSGILRLYMDESVGGKSASMLSRTLISKDFDFSKFTYVRSYTTNDLAPMRFVYAHQDLASEHEIDCTQAIRDDAIVNVLSCSTVYRINPNFNLSIQIYPSRYPLEEWPKYWGLMFDDLQSYKIESSEVSK